MEASKILLTTEDLLRLPAFQVLKY